MKYEELINEYVIYEDTKYNRKVLINMDVFYINQQFITRIYNLI